MGSTSHSDNAAFTESEIATFSTQVTKQKYVKFDHARALQLRIREKLTYEEIAERLNTTPAHVCNSLKKFLKYLEEPGDLYAYQENKPDLLETMELKLLTYLHDLLSDKKCASVKDVSLALKVVSELVRLNKGQSTSNVSVLLKSIEEAHQDPLSINKRGTDLEGQVTTSSPVLGTPSQDVLREPSGEQVSSLACLDIGNIDVCPEKSNSSGSSMSLDAPKESSNPTDSPEPIATKPSSDSTN